MTFTRASVVLLLVGCFDLPSPLVAGGSQDASAETVAPDPRCADAADGAECEPAQCLPDRIAFHPASTCQAGQCAPGTAEPLVCGDGLCLAACEDQQTCAKDCAIVPVLDLDVGEYLVAQLGNPGSPNAIAHYSCSEASFDNPELVYELKVTSNAVLRLAAVHDDEAVHGLLIPRVGAACSPLDCEADITASSSKTLEVIAGQRFCLVIDVAEPASGAREAAFHLSQEQLVDNCGILLNESFRHGFPGGWTIDGPGWRLGVDTVSGTTDVLEYKGQSPDPVESTITSPPVPIPAQGCENLRVSFAVWSTFAQDGPLPISAFVDVSLDDGATWTPHPLALTGIGIYGLGASLAEAQPLDVVRVRFRVVDGCQAACEGGTPVLEIDGIRIAPLVGP